MLTWESLRVYMQKDVVDKAGAEVAEGLRTDAACEQLEPSYAVKARFNVSHFTTKCTLPIKKKREEDPGKQPAEGPMQGSAARAAGHAWLATEYKGDALVHLQTRDGQILCKHRQRKARPIKPPVAAGSDLS
jgi:hypothetical protein